MTGALFFVLLFSSKESAAEALQPAALTAEIGVSAMRFHYAEFQDDGTILDRELGNIQACHSGSRGVLNTGWEDGKLSLWPRKLHWQTILACRTTPARMKESAMLRCDWTLV